MIFIERIKTAWAILQNLEVIEAVLVKIEALSGILERLSTIEKAISRNETLLSLANRIETLDAAVRRIELLAKPEPKPEINGVTVMVHPTKADLLEWNRLKLLTKFVQLADKGREIELEWQRIQQDEHDFLFAFQTSQDEESQAKYMFKKGVAEGVKWCISRFS